MSDGAAPAITAKTKQASLLAAILASTIVSVDSSVVNVALPAITEELGGGLAGQQWVANGYLLTLAALILISGSLADLFGERRVFVLGVAGFGITSVACAIAPTIGVLIAARALQGVSGALLTPAALAIIVSVFPPDERGKAIGTWTAWGGIGILLGPILGGQIVESASWRWVFALQVPLVLFALFIGATAVPEGVRDRIAAKIDVVGAVLCAAGLGAISFGLIQQPVLGWDSPAIIGSLAGGALVFAAFLVWEARSSAPMLPLGLFGRRNFSVGNVQTFAMYGGLSILFFFLTIFLQQVAGYSAVKAGAVSLVPTVVMFLLTRRFGALADTYGPKLFMSVGPALSAVGFALMLRVDADVSFVTVLLPALLVFSLGLAMTVPVLTAAVLADADENNAGIASATNNAIARTAGLLATAAVGALLASSYASGLDERIGARPFPPAGQAAIDQAKERALARPDLGAIEPGRRAEVAEASSEASVAAFRLAMGIGAILLALAAVVGAVGVVNPRRTVKATGCTGGAVVGHPQEVALPRRVPSGAPA